MPFTVVKQSYLGRFVLTYLLYVAFGVLSITLTSPIDHVAPFYLAAGVALAAVLTWGAAMWPAVALGGASVVAAGHALHNGGGLSAQAMGLIAVCALGSAAQAWVGAVLARRWVPGALTLEEPRDIALFFLLAGPLACLISSGVAVGYGAAVGLSLGVSTGGAFLTWWCGDTMGVLVATPVMLAFVGEPALVWRGRRVTVALPRCTRKAVRVATTGAAGAAVPTRRWTLRISHAT